MAGGRQAVAAARSNFTVRKYSAPGRNCGWLRGRAISRSAPGAMSSVGSAPEAISAPFSSIFHEPFTNERSRNTYLFLMLTLPAARSTAVIFISW